MRPLAIIALALGVLSPGWDAQAGGSTGPDRSALLIELRNGKFDDLDAQLLQLETAFENDRHQEFPVQMAFGSFASSDPTLEEPLRRWVARQPKSFAARLARGVYYNHLADLSRGAEAPPATPPQRLAEMARYQLLAQDDFRAAIDLRPLAIAAHVGIVAILVDRRDEAALQQHAATAASSLGPTFAVCDAYIARFDYHHGGDRAGLEQFISGPQYAVLCGGIDGRYFLEMAAGEAAGADDRMAAIDHFTLAASLAGNRLPRLARGLTFFQGDWYGGAIAEFDRILADHAEDPLVLFWRGMAKWRTQDPQAALKDMDAAIALDPLNPMFLAYRGSLLAERGWISQATADFKNAATFGEYDATVQGLRARFFAWRLKDLDLAAAAYGRLVELTPNDSQLWMEYSMILLQAHDCRALIAAERMRAVCTPDEACQFTQNNSGYNDALEQLRLERSCPDSK